jgi:DNA-binding IclR family transcriptional regulator
MASRRTQAVRPEPRQGRVSVQGHQLGIRRRGLTRAVGDPLHGVNAFAAPVYDHGGAVVLAVATMGAVGTFDVNWNSAIAKALTNCTKDISRRLGYGAISGKPPNER